MHDGTLGKAIEPLIADLVEWIGTGRPYTDVMDAWKTSCPRLPVWEEANSRGLLSRGRDPSGIEWVYRSSAGEGFLLHQRSG
jgi:hypothetical protein